MEAARVLVNVFCDILIQAYLARIEKSVIPASSATVQLVLTLLRILFAAYSLPYSCTHATWMSICHTPFLEPPHLKGHICLGVNPVVFGLFSLFLPLAQASLLWPWLCNSSCPTRALDLGFHLGLLDPHGAYLPWPLTLARLTSPLAYRPWRD